MRREDTLNKLEAYMSQCRESMRQQLEKWDNPLVNAKKGQQYQCRFSLPACLLLPRFESVPDIGLSLKQHPRLDHEFLLHGTPSRSGTFTLAFSYCSANLPDELINNAYFRRRFGNLRERHEIVLTVNPDPRELWKNIPTDRNLEYFKEDSASEHRMTGTIFMLAASQRGRSHAHAGLARDDDFALAHINGWHLLSVSDGAGSARYSRRGSALACDVAVKACIERLSVVNELDGFFRNARPDPSSASWLQQAKTLAYKLLPHAAFEAHKAIRAEARSREREIREYATTFLLALAKKFHFGWVILSFQIGDGAMAAFSGSGAIRLLAEPDEGEYGGQTRFLTMPSLFEGNELMRRLNLLIVPDLEGLMLMTDGVSDAKFATLANLRNPGLWRLLWQELSPMAEMGDGGTRLLDWLQFWSQGNHDDRTLAMLKVRAPLQLGVLPGASVPALPDPAGGWEGKFKLP